MTNRNAGSVVLLSGGMDSGVAALLALTEGPVHALTIEYGQRHWVEISAAKKIAGIVDHSTLNGTIANPTSENIAVWLGEKWAAQFVLRGVALVRVRVSETPRSAATWFA